MTKLVVFDMDGVILDSMKALKDLAVEVISSNYSMIRTQAEISYENTVGAPFAEQLELIFPGNPRNRRAAETYEASHRFMAPQFKLAPLAASILFTLRREEIRTALVSSTAEKLIKERLPQITNLPFDYVGGMRNEMNTKDQQIKEIAFLFQILSQEILFLGDSRSDRTCALLAGCEFQPTSCDLLATTISNFLSRKRR